MKKIFSIFIALLVTAILFTGCSKDILESETVYCRASINGTSYKDAIKLREALAYSAWSPIVDWHRFFATTDSVAYIQFILKDVNNEYDCRYVFGGIKHPKNEDFPKFGKVYEISYDPNLEVDVWNFVEGFLTEYLSEPRSNVPYGVMMYYKHGDYDKGIPCTSLEGSMTFEHYNAKSKQYEGTFNLHDVDKSNYEIIGNFELELKKYYK